MKIDIRPIERERYHGVQGKDSITRTKRIAPTVDTAKMEFITGLDETDLKYLKEKMPNTDFSSRFDPENPHPYWSRFNSALKLENNTVVLDTLNPLELVQYKLAKVSKFVANSMEEYNKGLYPEATHYIHNEEEEIEEKAAKLSIIKKATKKIDAMSLENRMNVLMLATNMPFKNNSADYVDVQLAKEIEENPQKMLDIAEYDKEDLALRSIVTEGLLKNRLLKEGHKIKYQGHVLGSTIEDVVKYLKDPENNEFRARFITDVKTK